MRRRALRTRAMRCRLPRTSPAACPTTPAPSVRIGPSPNVRHRAALRRRPERACPIRAARPPRTTPAAMTAEAGMEAAAGTATGAAAAEHLETCVQRLGPEDPGRASLLHGRDHRADFGMSDAGASALV